MPRCARMKSNDSIFHIMIRSISELLLFKNNNDKDTYLSFMKHYQKYIILKSTLTAL
ncbi:hypothetical protein [Clostridium rectalis]|uniref:hypothetical protein n=1 Tax=Clostridium rectalis TaxID=2040295 RepID=UPI001FA95322|nr:hypothetical protein [Clostridium rectalis]